MKLIWSILFCCPFISLSAPTSNALRNRVYDFYSNLYGGLTPYIFPSQGKGEQENFNLPGDDSSHRQKLAQNDLQQTNEVGKKMLEVNAITVQKNHKDERQKHPVKEKVPTASSTDKIITSERAEPSSQKKTVTLPSQENNFGTYLEQKRENPPPGNVFIDSAETHQLIRKKKDEKQTTELKRTLKLGPELKEGVGLDFHCKNKLNLFSKSLSSLQLMNYFLTVAFNSMTSIISQSQLSFYAILQSFTLLLSNFLLPILSLQSRTSSDTMQFPPNYSQEDSQAELISRIKLLSSRETSTTENLVDVVHDNSENELFGDQTIVTSSDSSSSAPPASRMVESSGHPQPKVVYIVFRQPTLSELLNGFSNVIG